MLKIAPETLATMRVANWPTFAERVRATLFEQHPHFLPCFPTEIQRHIVAIMLGRAHRWDLAAQDSLYAYCEAMITIAPNFDRHPEIERAVIALGGRRDRDFADLMTDMPPLLIASARAGASVLPLFVPLAFDADPIERQIEVAIPLVLGDRPDAGRAGEAAQQAMAEANAMGLAAVADAPLVVAACRSFWGPSFAQAPWAAVLPREAWTADEIVEFLRLRIAMEFGRFV